MIKDMNKQYIRCWTCVGNGITKYPNCDVTTCQDCKGTGVDERKTFDLSISKLEELPNVKREGVR